MFGAQTLKKYINVNMFFFCCYLSICYVTLACPRRILDECINTAGTLLIIEVRVISKTENARTGSRDGRQTTGEEAS